MYFRRTKKTEVIQTHDRSQNDYSSCCRHDVDNEPTAVHTNADNAEHIYSSPDTNVYSHAVDINSKTAKLQGDNIKQNYTHNTVAVSEEYHHLNLHGRNDMPLNTYSTTVVDTEYHHIHLHGLSKTKFEPDSTYNLLAVASFSGANGSEADLTYDSTNPQRPNKGNTNNLYDSLSGSDK